MSDTEPDRNMRSRAIDALLALAAERPWHEVTLQAVAERAGASLAELRAHYDGRLAILADYARSVDEAVLADLDDTLADQPQRERLFDILFARFEAHAAHRPALKAIARAALRDPLLALELNRITLGSMTWMLAAAGIGSAGLRGAARAQGLAVAWARVMRVFLDDEDAGLARTMAALDKRLREAERIGLGLDRLQRLVGRRRESRAAPEPAVDEDIAEGHPT